ncbi:hypothetical protein [Ferrovibrio sp.]|uniref:hypothetical protein n=1 Tax=Ferrovibrio sp. TaxID=1917215 RepID=UPI0035B400C2
MPSLAASLPAAEPRYDDPAVRLAVVARSAARALEPREVAERITAFEAPDLRRYLQTLRLAKACLESLQLLATAKLVGISAAHDLGRAGVDEMPDQIEAVIRDCDLAVEIERIKTALTIWESCR